MECSIKVAAKKRKKAVKSKTTMNGENGVAVGESGSVRKIRSFKRIRGFLPGESRRESRTRRARDRAQASASASRGVALLRLNSEDSSNQGDDDTIYDGDVEDRSVSSRGLDSSPPKTIVQSKGLSKSKGVTMEDHGAFYSSNRFKTPYLRKLLVPVLLLSVLSLSLPSVILVIL
jgi:hypothetical protein